MRICRYLEREREAYGFLVDDETLLPIIAAAHALGFYEVPAGNMLDLLPGGRLRDEVLRIQSRITPAIIHSHARPVAAAQLLVPIPSPGKMLLLAGNYPQHVAEGGGQAEDRAKTFPYVFMKPTTTLTHPGDPIRIPEISPHEIDWEVELGVIIGRTCKGVPADQALDYVAGYTVINDISDRAFRPNSNRTSRPKDSFFDWQHGKWHDTFCPIGPCVLPAEECEDPQNLRLTLSVNGQVEQDGSTADMVFPVAAIIEFLSQFVTLHPGDLISTGTPAGVGKAKGKFLKSGDTVIASVEKIGGLVNPVA